MPAYKEEQLIQFVARLIAEAAELDKNADPNWMHDPSYAAIDLEGFSKLTAACKQLVYMLGERAEPWKERLTDDAKNNRNTTQRLLGILRVIEEALKSGLLIRVEDLVMAEAFDDLLEHAEYLLREGYYVAAGVLGRAVLEEHMRKWCHRGGIMPQKARPTLSDLNQSLYRAKRLDKIGIKQVDAMVAVGNDCAHNQPVKQEHVERFLRDVRDFVSRNPSVA